MTKTGHHFCHCFQCMLVVLPTRMNLARYQEKEEAWMGQDGYLTNTLWATDLISIWHLNNLKFSFPLRRSSSVLGYDSFTPIMPLPVNTGTHISHCPEEALFDAQAVPADIRHHVRCNSKQESYQFLCVLPNKQIRVVCLGDFTTLL